MGISISIIYNFLENYFKIYVTFILNSVTYYGSIPYYNERFFINADLVILSRQGYIHCLFSIYAINHLMRNCVWQDYALLRLMFEITKIIYIFFILSRITSITHNENNEN